MEAISETRHYLPLKNRVTILRFTLTLQKSRMLFMDPAIGEIRGVKGEAVVTYREPLTTKEMQYPRLSPDVKNMTNKLMILEFTFDDF